MDDPCMEVFGVQDDGGATLHNQMRVDGLRVNTFNRDPEITTAVVRNIKNLKIRDDDVLLCTQPKSGTHWCFEILTMLLNNTSTFSDYHKEALMLAYVPEAELEKFPSPRILNTHCPYNMLPSQTKEKKTKIVLLLRNPKDVVVSYFYHHRGMKLFDYEGKFSDYLKLFMQGNLEYNSWFDSVLEFEKAMEDEPGRIHLVYYEDLKENGVEEITKLARFLGVPAVEDANLIKVINENCKFQRMKKDKEYEPALAELLFKDPKNLTFFRKGEIGDWKNHFTVADNEAFDALYEKKMATSKLKFRFEPKP